MLPTRLMTTRLRKKFNRCLGKEVHDGRKNGDMWWLRPSASRGAHVGKEDLDVDAGETSCWGARVRRRQPV